MEIDLSLGLLWYFVFVYSTVCHEAAHAWAAMKLGDYTAYNGGQVSLDPIPHMRREPIGMIVVPILTFFLNASKGVLWMMGWASAPYDPRWALAYPRRAALMAMAGPAANLILVIASGIIMRVGLGMGWLHGGTWHDMTHICTAEGDALGAVALVLSVTFSLNLLLCIFNLLPLPPLDGSCIPLLFLSGSQARAYQQMLWHPGVQMIGLYAMWHGAGYLFWPALRYAYEMVFRW